jgi:hypothetical protein
MAPFTRCESLRSRRRRLSRFPMLSCFAMPSILPAARQAARPLRAGDEACERTARVHHGHIPTRRRPTSPRDEHSFKRVRRNFLAASLLAVGEVASYPLRRLRAFVGVDLLGVSSLPVRDLVQARAGQDQGRRLRLEHRSTAIKHVVFPPKRDSDPLYALARKGDTVNRRRRANVGTAADQSR